MGVCVDVDSWLEPVASQPPCGSNLEYDPAFLELEEAARGKPDQEFGTDDGDGVRRIEGSGPDWATVRKLSEALLGRSKDLRVAVQLTRALTRTNGLAGLEQGSRLILGLLERYWDDVHPMLDRDDNDDPTERLSALAGLSASDVLVADLREAWVLRSRQAGVLSVRDIEVASGRLQPKAGTEPLSETQALGMIAAGIAEDADLAIRPRRINDTIKAIEAFISDRVGSGMGVDLKPLLTLVYPVMQFVERSAPRPAEAAAEIPDAPGPGAEGTTAAGPAVVVARPGEIRSRTDVVETLERLCDFLMRTEPTSPVPLVLRRAQKMMSMSFLELMNDVAPDGLQQAERVVGVRFESEDS